MSEKLYDLCIIGAGIAGALISAEATRKGLKVALIEAGRRFAFGDRMQQLKRRQILRVPDWEWTHEARDRFVDSSAHALGVAYQLNSHRLKGVGGSTLHWGGRINRLMPSDFRTASSYGHGLDWPLSYDDLEPYYTRADWEIGVSGTPNSSQPARSRDYPLPGFPLGHDDGLWLPVAKKMGFPLYPASMAINSQPYDGRTQCLAFASCEVCPSGARYSADFHVAKAEASGFCDLFVETTARRIELDTAGTVKTVHCSAMDGSEREVRAKQYVITAHAVESARLLLLSGVGNHSDQVGRNFMEHAYVISGGYVADHNFNPQRVGFSRLETLHYYDGIERLERGAIKLEFSFNHDPLLDMERLHLWGPALAKHDHDSFGHWAAIEAETEILPDPGSRITLHADVTDFFGDPVPHIQLAFGEVDRRTQLKAHSINTMLLEAAGVRHVQHEKLRFGSHHTGTCRMSDDPDLGVVDRNCRVHGTANLYLTGSSVFPTAGAAQPTLTVAALSLRLADHLLAG